MDGGKIYEFHIEKSGLPNKGFHKLSTIQEYQYCQCFLAVPLEMNKANDVCNLEM